MTHHADAPKVVVIGAGIAGSMVAARLASHCDVVVLERGGEGAPIDHPTLAMRDAASFLATPYPQGSGLGGGSRVNGLVFEGPPADYWQTLVASGLHVFSGAKDELSHFEVEVSAADGAVDRALLAAHPRARPMLLATRNGKRVTAWQRMSPHGVVTRSGITASHLKMKGDRALAVVTGSGEEVVADHIVLCAGAISSAAIAARSGLIKSETRLLDHPGVIVEMGVDEPVTNSFAGAVVLERDVMIMSVNGPTGGLLIGLMSPNSEGALRIDGDSVSIDRGLLSDTRDQERFRSALRDVEHLMTHSAFDSLVRSSVRLDDEHWMDRVGEGMWHAAGTMAMGATADSILDESGRLRGTTNVWCMDASVFPEIPPVPPQAAVMATAGVLARRFLSLTTS